MKRRTISGIIAASTVAALAVVAVGLSAQAAEPGLESKAQVEVTPRPTPSATTPPIEVAEAPTVAEEPAVAEQTGDPTMAASYNEYTDPSSPSFVTDADKAIWWGKESVLKQCMLDKGLGYVDWRWWQDELPQPRGLSYDESIAWLVGFYGENRMQPSGIPEESGCSGLSMLMDSGAMAIPVVPLPADVPPALTPRQAALVFQDAIRTCMAEKGFEYLYFEWWNPKYQTFQTDPNRHPAEPEGLSDEQKAEWNFAVDGDTGAGSDYRWEDAGCSGYATHVTGNDNMH